MRGCGDGAVAAGCEAGLVLGSKHSRDPGSWLWSSHLQGMGPDFHKAGSGHLLGQGIVISLGCSCLLFDSEI